MPIPTATFVCFSCHAVFERLAPFDTIHAVCDCGDIAGRREPAQFEPYFEKEGKNYEDQVGR